MKSYYTTFILTMLIIASTFIVSSAQIDWTRQNVGNPVLNPETPGSWEDFAVYAPFVLKHGDTLKMWYTGIKSYDVQQIGYAISYDGINWERDSHNPVLPIGAPGSWDAEYVGYPKIILVDTTYHMWYAGHNNSSNPIFRIGYATSPDGINWTKYPDPVLILGDPGEWDSASGGGHTYFFDGDTFHLWYVGTDDLSTRRYRTGYAKSSDGITWEKFPGNPIFYGEGSWDSLKIHNPCVIVDSSGYQMWYQGKYGSNYRIGYATSSDGINWAALDTFTLDIGDPGTWDDKLVGTPHVFLDDTTFRMWYTGDDGISDYGYHIGYATALVTVLEEIDSKQYPKRFVLKQNYPNPFNPSTTIEFTLPKTEFIELQVYNILGKVVATLASNKLNQGNHIYTFDGKNLASGVYYYQLLAGEYRAVKKMILIK